MAKFVLSAFTDEYSPLLDKQIEGMKLNGITYTEIRGVNKKNISALTLDEVKAVKEKLDKNGLKVWSIGSPLGKIKLTDDFEKHLELTNHVCEIAKILDAPRIRMFSFYVDNTEIIAPYREQVMSQLAKMLDVAKSYGVTLCHENEKGIYGEKIEGCLDIMKTFGGEIKCVFDPANFIQANVKPYPDAFNALEKYIYYMHIKDSTAEKTIVPSGKGIGEIPQIIKHLSCRDGEMILSVEPHLKVFEGLAALEKEGNVSEFVDKYPTSEAAFNAAIMAIKQYI